MLLSKRITGIAATFAIASCLATTGLAVAGLSSGTQVEFSGDVPPTPAAFAQQMRTYLVITILSGV